MSQPSSPSSFQSLFDAALQDYTTQTGTKLDDQPLAKELQDCDSVDAVSSLLQSQAQRFHHFRGEDGKIMKSLKSVVNVLYNFTTSGVLGEGVGIVRPKFLISDIVSNIHSLAVATGKSSICRFRRLTRRTFLSLFLCTYPYDAGERQAVKDVSASYDALVDLFESIECFLARLRSYTTITLTPAMSGIVVKIMVEILSTLALVTKQVKQGRLSEPSSRSCVL
jgi:fungal STAND N-terminal Goodbye domain